MKHIFQKIVDPIKGDCLKCAVASLLDMEYDEVPNFIEYGVNATTKLVEFMNEHINNRPEYMFTYFNPNICDEDYPYGTLLDLPSSPSINGLALGVVASPVYHDSAVIPEQQVYTHSVIIDANCNIVFDPNPNYQNLEKYPFADTIGFNGILRANVFISRQFIHAQAHLKSAIHSNVKLNEQD